MKVSKRLAVISFAVGFISWLTGLPLRAEHDKLSTLKVDGLERSFIVHTPPGYSQLSSLPVVIMLHGGGGTAEGAIRETGWDKKADQANFIAVFPEGLPRNPNAPSRFVGNPQTWDDGSHRFSHNNDDVAFLSGLIDNLKDRYKADPKRIYLTGFSNGASMAFLAGVKLSERVAAVAPVAGAFWDPPEHIAKPVSLLYITGTEDPLNPLEGGIPKMAMARWGTGIGRKAKPPVSDSIDAWLKLAGLSTIPVETSNTNGVSLKRYKNPAGTEVGVYLIDDCGHTWPGGVSTLPQIMVGKSTNKLNATNIIWDFFSRHSSMNR